MKSFRPGASVIHRTVVRGWMKPHLEGLVRHPLYATWAMVYHMEVAARKLLAPCLEPGEEAVGAAISVRHLGPARIGDPIRITCALARVRGNRVYARLEAFVKKRKIGEGTQVQAVMSKKRFLRLTRAS